MLQFLFCFVFQKLSPQLTIITRLIEKKARWLTMFTDRQESRRHNDMQWKKFHTDPLGNNVL